MRRASRTRRESESFPVIASDYPIKPWVDPVSKESFQTATVEQDDGRFISIIVSDPHTRFSAKTRKQAEEGVIRLYLAFLRREIPYDDESEEQDEEDMRVIREAERRGEFIPLADVLKKYGRSVGSPRRRVGRS